MSNPRETLLVIGHQNTDIVRVNSDGFFREAGRRDPLTDKLYQIFEQVVKTGEIGAPDFEWFHSPFCWTKEVFDQHGMSFLCVIDTGLDRDGTRGLSKMGIYQTDKKYRRKVADMNKYSPYTQSLYYANFVLIKVPDTNDFFCCAYFEQGKIHLHTNFTGLTELPLKVSKRVDRMFSQVLKAMGIPSENSLQQKERGGFLRRFLKYQR